MATKKPVCPCPLTMLSAQSLPFTTVQHRVSTMDAQPASSTEASMVVLVTGQLIVGFIVLVRG